MADDLGLSVESFFYVKRGLHTFIDSDLQPADLAGILRTGGSSGALQPFTTDRRILHAAVDGLRWNGFSRSGVEAFEPINQKGAFALSGIVLRGDEAASSADSMAASGVSSTAAQGLRVYQRGTELCDAYEIYNAGTRVQAATSIWRGSEKIVTLPTDTLTSPVGNERRFSAAGRLKLGEGLPPGGYTLQVSAATADPGERRPARTAVQQIHFDLR